MTPVHKLVAKARELRRSRRRTISRLITGQLLSPYSPVAIRDISIGGFAMSSAFAVRVGDTLAVRFTAANGSSFLVRATVAHCRRFTSAVGADMYLTGLKFAAERTIMGQRAIATLIQTVNDALAAHRGAA